MINATPSASSSSCQPGAVSDLSALTSTVLWDDLLPHRDYLIRFAKRKLHDPALAEDLVHDVFEAVATGRASFGGRSALRSWLTAVLKNKIVDMVRQRSGTESLDGMDGKEGPAVSIACSQPRPDEVLQQRETVRHVLAGIAKLPKSLRDAIELRVLQDQSAQEVCEALAITENNLFQRMFRARQTLASNLSMVLH
jgi:RNA polymerase sigma-70 factor (ECF subfamily)